MLALFDWEQEIYGFFAKFSTFNEYDFKRKKLRKVKVLLRRLFLFMLFFAAENSHATGFKQELDVRIGVFDAAVVTLNYETKGNGYDIAAEVATANLFDTLYPFKGRYQSLGKNLEDGVRPELYQADMRSRSHKRMKKILYDKYGKAYKRVSAKDNKKNEKKIANMPASADTADLQAVFAEVIKNFQEKQSCALKREVYDGKKHYLAIAADKGSESRYFDFSGRVEPAYKCAFYIKNLKENNDNILWDVSAEKPINMWIGLDKKTKMPFLLEIGIDSTPLGALKVTPRTLKIW